MGLFDLPSNPVEIYDVNSNVLEIAKLQEQLDEKIHNFFNQTGCPRCAGKNRIQK